MATVKDTIIATLLDLTKEVTDYDWEDNDEDAVKAVENLRRYADSVRELLQ